jgi:peptide/nickel transport system permease protein
MLQYSLRRIIAAIPLLLGASLVSFVILHLIPGNPARVLLGTQATPAQVAALTHQLGLDRPIVVQYIVYVGNLLHGNLGTSYLNQETVVSEIAQQGAYTLQLTVGALFVALLVGVPIGLVAGTRPGSWMDRVGMTIAVLGVAVPYFWLALLFIIFFGVDLRILPVLGTGGPSHLVLPCVSLGIGYSAFTARLLRASLIDAYRQPFVHFSRAMGLPGSRILFRSILKYASGPVVTALGLQLGNLLSGAAATEIIFGRAGLGSLTVHAILAKDIPTVQGMILFIAAVYIVINLLVDIFKGVIDPRVRLEWTEARA